MNKVSVLIVDDLALVRDGIKALLEKQNFIEIVGEAEDGHDAINKAAALKPDIILMDVFMPDISGIEATRLIKEKFPDIKVIFLSINSSEEFITSGIKAGGSGYLPKDIRQDELVTAIIEVDKYGKYFSPSIMDMVFNNFCQETRNFSSGSKTASKNKLSKREVEVLKLLASGLGKKDIAEKLFISVRTVDAHRSNIKDKLNLGNTADLVKYALSTGLIPLD